jgi:hypothetical protein
MTGNTNEEVRYCNCGCGRRVFIGNCCTQCYYEFHESKEELMRGEREPEDRDEEEDNDE